MAKTSIIRSVYADRFLYHLDSALLWQGLCNTDYEGDPAAGSVIINTLTDPSVSDYSGTATVSDIATTSQTLSINHAKYFAVAADDWDKARTNLNLIEESAQRGAYALASAVDAAIASSSFSEGTALTFGGLGTSGSAYIPTGSTGAGSAYDMVVDMNSALTNAGVPQVGRFAVLPAFAVANIAKDSRILTQNPVVLANGLVQGVMINGMQIFQSNNLTTFSSGTTTEYCAVAGHNKAIAYVGALKALEVLRSTTAFADIIRGLYGWGHKILHATSVQTTVIRAAAA